MPIETKEKFAPNSFIANVNNEAKLILEYDLTNLGYYRISPLKEKAFLYSGEKPAGKKSYNLKKEVELAKDDLVAIKSFDNNNNIAYVIVLSGEENLKHGWVKLADIRNANSNTIPNNWIWLCICVPFFWVFRWVLNFGQTQIEFQTTDFDFV